MNIKHLAQSLNLSFSTVSKALRDSHEISAATKNRVLQKAKEMNYEVNPFASALRKQKSKTVAVVIPQVVSDFFGPVINGIESVAHEKGYHVLIYLTHEDMEKEVAMIKLLQNGRVDGIMMSISAQTTNTAHLEELKNKEIPLVFFDRIAQHIDVPKVTTDDHNSSRLATELLIRNGCRKIAFLAINQSLSITNKRLNGYQEALQRNNIKPDVTLISSCCGNDEKNKDEIRRLLRKVDRPDAIFASVEKLAIATYEVCEEMNLKIPDDIKVLTFSNSYTAPLLNPSLTTITQPAFEIGRESAAILFKLIEKKGQKSYVEKLVLNSILVERNSTKRSW